MSKTVIRSFSC